MPIGRLAGSCDDCNSSNKCHRREPLALNDGCNHRPRAPSTKYLIAHKMLIYSASTIRSSTIQLCQDKQRGHHIVILLSCIGILIASLAFRSDGTGLFLFGLKWPLHCLLNQTLDMKCALCGLSRSLCSLAHGDLKQSLDFHLLGPAVFAFICLQIAYRIYALVIYPTRPNRKLTRVNLSLAVMLAAAIFVNWLFYLGGLIV